MQLLQAQKFFSQIFIYYFLNFSHFLTIITTTIIIVVVPIFFNLKQLTIIQVMEVFNFSIVIVIMFPLITGVIFVDCNLFINFTSQQIFTTTIIITIIVIFIAFNFRNLNFIKIIAIIMVLEYSMAFLNSNSHLNYCLYQVN